MKEIPVLFDAKENCCGCTACYAICLVGAIEMLPDEEGFLYPTINAEKCMDCHKCVTVCAFKENQKEKGFMND